MGRTLRELMSLEGRVALVTGGAGHLGRVFTDALLEQGARLVLVDRDPAGLAAAVERLERSERERVRTLAVDLLDERATAGVIPEAVAVFGRLDVLVNNAAFTGASGIAGFAVPFPQQSLEAWNAAVRVNLGAVFQLTQAAREPLAASGHGSVVNVGSIYGVVGPDLGLYEGTAMGNPAAYGASKGGVLQLTRYLATVLAPAVRVNSLSPGGIARGQPASFVQRYEARAPLGRMATEEDMKGALAYLASDLSAYVTGQDLLVDGGWTAW